MNDTIRDLSKDLEKANMRIAELVEEVRTLTDSRTGLDEAIRYFKKYDSDYTPDVRLGAQLDDVLKKLTKENENLLSGNQILVKREKKATQRIVDLAEEKCVLTNHQYSLDESLEKANERLEKERLDHDATKARWNLEKQNRETLAARQLEEFQLMETWMENARAALKDAQVAHKDVLTDLLGELELQGLRATQLHARITRLRG